MGTISYRIDYDKDNYLWSATVLDHRKNMEGEERILHLESEVFDDHQLLLAWLEDRFADDPR